jgi:hypothetical protein
MRFLLIAEKHGKIKDIPNRAIVWEMVAELEKISGVSREAYTKPNSDTA